MSRHRTRAYCRATAIADARQSHGEQLKHVTRSFRRSAFDRTIEQTQDFTDSAYTSHEHRETLLVIQDRCQKELNLLLRMAVSIVSVLISLVCKHVA